MTGADTRGPGPGPQCCPFLVGLDVHVDQAGLGDAVQMRRLGERANSQDVTGRPRSVSERRVVGGHQDQRHEVGPLGELAFALNARGQGICAVARRQGLRTVLLIRNQAGRVLAAMN